MTEFDYSTRPFDRSITRWTPDTRYTATQAVIIPGGKTAICNTSHISGQAYSGANWTEEGSSGGSLVFISVKDSGAVGDGVTDDTAAINAALASVPAGGGIVYFPAGDYVVSSSVLVRIEGTLIWGAGTGNRIGGTQGSIGSRIRAKVGLTGSVVQVQRVADDRPLHGVSIQNITIDGNNIGTGVDGLIFRVNMGSMFNVHIWNCTGNALRVRGYSSPSWDTYDTRIAFCLFGYSSGAGIYLDNNSADLHITNCISLSNQDGMQVIGGSSQQVTACHFYGNTRNNIFFNGSGSRSKFANCKIEGSNQHLVVIDTTTAGYSDIQFTGCGFSTIDQSQTNNTWDYVLILGPSGNGAGRTEFSGCTFSLKGGSSIKARYGINLSTSAAQTTVISGCNFGPASHWGTAPLNNASNSSLQQYVRNNSGLGDIYIANVQTTSYTLTADDAIANTVVEMNSASGVVVTVPPNAQPGFMKGNQVRVTQVGAGQITFSPGAGVTLRTPRSLTSRAQWSTVVLRQRATNEWVLEGDLT
jgi:hypothetical protein